VRAHNIEGIDKDPITVLFLTADLEDLNLPSGTTAQDESRIFGMD
jgi:hypothetical protein